MPMHIQAKLIVIGAAVASLLTSTAIPAKIVPRYELYMATQSGNHSGKEYVRSRNNRFSCDDTIYLFLESSDKTLAGQTLDAVWINLQSGERHETSNTFALQKRGKRYWSWSGITFPLSGSSPLGILTVFLDPAAGREKFIGEWKITARVKDRFDRTVTMHVLC